MGFRNLQENLEKRTYLPALMLKFIYTEKATKFCEIFTLLEMKILFQKEFHSIVQTLAQIRNFPLTPFR